MRDEFEKGKNKTSLFSFFNLQLKPEWFLEPRGCMSPSYSLKYCGVQSPLPAWLRFIITTSTVWVFHPIYIYIEERGIPLYSLLLFYTWSWSIHPVHSYTFKLQGVSRDTALILYYGCFKGYCSNLKLQGVSRDIIILNYWVFQGI